MVKSFDPILGVEYLDIGSERHKHYKYKFA